jgi:ATP-dependent helicase/nuclease subunit A
LKTFKLYRSSAGSGKTRTLAKEFILLALSGKTDYYRYILAVTFANKATLEMKARIMKYLDDFAKGNPNDLEGEIKETLKLTDAQLVDKSRDVQSAILHHYSQFAISTIDAFFQKVIRSFTREAGLLGNFRLEVDNELVMSEVIGDLMDELGHNRQLTEWVVKFSKDKLNEGENWNITRALEEFAQVIFKESFKVIEDDILSRFEREVDPYSKFITIFKAEQSDFLDFMSEKAKEAMTIMARNSITSFDFNYGNGGTAFSYFEDFSLRQYREVKKRVQDNVDDALSWPKKKGLNYERFLKLVRSDLHPVLIEMVEYSNQNYIRYKSAQLVLENFYSFGLLADITRKLKQYKEENNLMLLSDAPKFLNKVINDSDTPFIYEKVGSFFRNYLIDEFQDTSGYQWKNFLPLLKDSLDQSQSNMVVGDVKQSIYRWRGGDLQLLQSGVEKEIGPEMTEVIPLDTNYRSAENIIKFNNELFRHASVHVSRTLNHLLPSDVFNDVAQNSVKFPGKGYVRVNFIEKDDDERSWDEIALQRIPALLEELQSRKIDLRDIAILVRTNDQGQRIAKYLLEYKISPEAKSDFKYDVVSNESLRLDTASSVNLLVSALRYIDNPLDAIVRGQLAFEVMKGSNPESIFYEAGRNNLQKILPKEFLQNSLWLNKLSIFELTEELIRIFALGIASTELAYLQAFQDQVLEFSAQEKNDLAAFLTWWENNKWKSEKSLKVAGTVNAVNILTIHKSKGLQFKYVIIPFCDWKMDDEKEPLLWITSELAPYAKLGHLAVRYKSSLKDTFFEKDYQEERIKAHLDNLNILYVALTRAEEGLFVSAARPSDKSRETRLNDGKVGTAGDLMYEVISTNGLAGFNPQTSQFESGILQKLKTEGKEELIIATELTHYASYDWRQKLVIKKQGAEFFEEEVSEKRAKINYGIMLHAMLSKVHHAGQVKEVLDDLLVRNELTQEEVRIVGGEIERMMKHPVIGKWYGKEWQVKNESIVLVPGGRQSRIDRIMMSAKRTIIIDYKTGERKGQDRKQVEEYASVLSQMGYPNIEAYLLYLDGMEVVEVVSKSNLSLGL